MIKLMDCTLRDGANVVGKGFPKDLTLMMLEGLIAAGVPVIEFGNAGGIGAYEVAGFTQAETDDAYIEMAQPYLGKGSEIGMFLNAERYLEKSVAAAKNGHLDFLRVGVAAGDVAKALKPVRDIKAAGMKAFFASMKAYLLPPDALAEEAKQLEDAGLDMFTVMDSAGTMMPDEVAAYVEALKKAVSIPVAFHGHNNLSMAAANALSAYKAGADMLDCGLMGMARSAGNCATEVCAAFMQRLGEMQDIDLYALLACVNELGAVMKERYEYHNPIPALDLVYGISGAHSSFGKLFKKVAEETGADLYKLIIKASAIDRKKPSEELLHKVAAEC